MSCTWKFGKVGVNELTASKLGCNCENPSVITPLSTWKILSGYYKKHDPVVIDNMF